MATKTAPATGLYCAYAPICAGCGCALQHKCGRARCGYCARQHRDAKRLDKWRDARGEAKRAALGAGATATT